LDISNSKENIKEKGYSSYTNASINMSNMKSIDENRFSVTNSPPFKDIEIDEGLEEYNNCLKNALTEAINENEKVIISYYFIYIIIVNFTLFYYALFYFFYF
jgi:hypothetical protein